MIDKERTVRALYFNVKANKPEIIGLKDDFREWQRLIDCDTVTHAYFSVDGQNFLFLCDDNALIRSDIVPVATAFDSEKLPALYGNFLVLPPETDGDGGITNLSTAQANHLLSNFYEAMIGTTDNKGHQGFEKRIVLTEVNPPVCEPKDPMSTDSNFSSLVDLKDFFGRI